MLGGDGLVRHWQSCVIYVIEIVDHIDRTEHVIAIGRAAIALKIMNEAAESAGTDREILVYLVGDPTKAYV